MAALAAAHFVGATAAAAIHAAFAVVALARIAAVVPAAAASLCCAACRGASFQAFSLLCLQPAAVLNASEFLCVVPPEEARHLVESLAIYSTGYRQNIRFLLGELEQRTHNIYVVRPCDSK